MSYNPIITHDIDRYYKWKHWKSLFGEYYRILRGKSSWKFIEVKNSYAERETVDPFSNLMTIAELDLNAGLQSVFYIMTTEEQHPLNINDYSIENPAVQSCLQALINSGVEVGIHPGINTYNDKGKMQMQKVRLEKAIGQHVTRSRQHYLKYEYPNTFKLLQSIGIKNDSSILVNLIEEDEGRRTTYKMFDDGNTDGITQTPLVFMDTHHMSKSDSEILDALEESIQPAKEEGGEIMILWHNNNISNERELGLYKEALEVIRG